MKQISMQEIPEKYHKIYLQNGSHATLYQVILTRVMEVNPDEDTFVYKYKVPCPVCGHKTLAFSYDGKYFSNIQLNCRHCGVFFRPVVKR